ncbi:hypothetical protein ACFLZB_03930 [Nanoarchaeota archaeon]
MGDNMPIVGINIAKINVEKKESRKGKISINNNISIKSIDEKDLALGKSKQKGLKFNFVYTCDYTPGLGKIDLEGHVMFLGEESKLSGVKKQWDKDKKISPELMGPVLNAALNKCNIAALKLSDEVGLPSPVPMPRVTSKENKK